jgi:hypothetical protein
MADHRITKRYNATRPPDGPRNIMFAVGKSIRLGGFEVANHFI